MSNMNIDCVFISNLTYYA